MVTGDYPPIAQHAFLSDCHTAALIGPGGSIDWLPAPRFDSPSIFARLLDRKRGGSWELDVAGGRESGRRYLDSSLILESAWEAEEGSLLVHDFLAVKPPGAAGDRGIVPAGVLVRLVRCRGGRAQVGLRVDARPEYGRRAARWNEGGETLVADDGALWLAGDPAPEVDGGGGVRLAGELRAGDAAVLALGYGGGPGRRIDRATAERLLGETADAWRVWGERSDYGGFASDEVNRSAVVLRGLIFDESGGMLAAPTTSLPEWIGGTRNWDYRYVWHRDAALVVLALMRLGHAEEASRYLHFLLDHCAHCDDHLEPVIAIDGGTEMPERELDHLEGYRGSSPVRIGNGARGQRQLDGYGHVLDAALSLHETTGGLTGADLAELRRVVEMCRERWQEPDHGKWEVRDGERHWTHSKLYAWVCMDRGVRLAELCGDHEAPLDDWRAERDAIRRDLLANGYDSELRSFVQSYGAQTTDGALLRIPLVGFLDGDDPRMLGTLERIDAELGAEDHLIHRYDTERTDDGVGGPEGAFLLCSFDMVSALMLAGRAEEARKRFDALRERGGPFGLYSEEMASDGTMLGNYPQAFTHLALIDAALNLDQAGRRDALHEWADRGGPQAGG